MSRSFAALARIPVANGINSSEGRRVRSGVADNIV